MRSVRRKLSSAALIWLVFQVLALGIAPAALCVTSNDAPAIQCTCAHNDGQPCPMHHPDKSNKCSCRGTPDSGAVAMLSLLGPPALIVQATTAVHPLTPSSAAPLPAFAVADGVSPVDSPPPRA